MEETAEIAAFNFECDYAEATNGIPDGVLSRIHQDPEQCTAALCVDMAATGSRNLASTNCGGHDLTSPK